jgi:hypothetical protein
MKYWMTVAIIARYAAATSVDRGSTRRNPTHTRINREPSATIVEA